MVGPKVKIFQENAKFPSDEEVERHCNRWMNGYFSWAGAFGDPETVPESELDSAREGFLSAVAWFRNCYTKESQSS